MNALYMTTYEIDEKCGTDYFKRLEKYLAKLQDENFMLVGGMTDVKGDRSKRPSQQSDPDVFTHVVEKRADGIVVRGAKAHQTGAVNSHEIMIMPCQAMQEGDEAYAVVAAVPLDAPGITLIFGRQSNDDRKDPGHRRRQPGIRHGRRRSARRLRQCFRSLGTGFHVRRNRIQRHPCRERFATLHRQNYGGCKGGVADVIIGATALTAQYQGSLGASHIKDKLVEMLHLAETVYAGSVACSALGSKTKSGAYYPDPMLANCTKHNITRMIYEISADWRRISAAASWLRFRRIRICAAPRSASMSRST